MAWAAATWEQVASDDACPAGDLVPVLARDVHFWNARLSQALMLARAVQEPREQRGEGVVGWSPGIRGAARAHDKLSQCAHVDTYS